MKRGDIWTVAGGVYTSKPRPSIVVQDDGFGQLDSVVVVPITSVDLGTPVIRVPIGAGDITGIRVDSFAMIDKIAAVRHRNIGERVGRVSDTTLAEIERALMVFLGLAA